MIIRWKNMALIAVYNIVLVVVIGVVAIKATPWALLGLLFLAGSKDCIKIKLKDGTVIEAAGDDAIEVAREIEHRLRL